jgi:putative PepSY-like beta-lactamase-inhibitor
MMLRARAAAAFMFSLSLVFCATAFAQNSEKSVKMKDLPEAVRKTVQEQSKGATLRGLAKEVDDGKTFYEAELKVNGHNKDVLIDPSGAVVEIEEQVAFASLPAEVQATIKKGARKGKITAVESITKNNTLEAYEAHVTKAGKKSEIKVAPDGKLITTENEQTEKEEKAEGNKAPKTKKP